MDYLQQIFELCIVPLLGVITTYIVKYINKKTNEIDSKVTDETVSKYINTLSEIIKEAVVSTNQVYVDSLKGKNAFTKEAQEEAFKQTQEKVYSIITTEMKDVLTGAYGDLDLYITTKIEAEVNAYKVNVSEETK